MMEGCQKSELEPKTGMGSGKVFQICPDKVLRLTKLAEAGGKPVATAIGKLKQIY